MSASASPQTDLRPLHCECIIGKDGLPNLGLVICITSGLNFKVCTDQAIEAIEEGVSTVHGLSRTHRLCSNLIEPGSTVPGPMWHIVHHTEHNNNVPETCIGNSQLDIIPLAMINVASCNHPEVAMACQTTMSWHKQESEPNIQVK